LTHLRGRHRREWRRHDKVAVVPGSRRASAERSPSVSPPKTRVSSSPGEMIRTVRTPSPTLKKPVVKWFSRPRPSDSFPVRLPNSRNGHWMVVVDFGGPLMTACLRVGLSTSSRQCLRLRFPMRGRTSSRSALRRHSSRNSRPSARAHLLSSTAGRRVARRWWVSPQRQRWAQYPPTWDGSASTKAWGRRCPTSRRPTMRDDNGNTRRAAQAHAARCGSPESLSTWMFQRHTDATCTSTCTAAAVTRSSPCRMSGHLGPNSHERATAANVHSSQLTRMGEIVPKATA
jgi:hypothetical protein